MSWEALVSHISWRVCVEVLLFIPAVYGKFPKKAISQIKEVSVLIVGRFLNTNYISLIDIRLFRLPTSLCGDILVYFSSSSVQSLSRVWLFATPWTAACQASLSITNSQSLLRLTSIESMMPSSHLILCRPLLLLPSIFPTSGSFPMSQLFASGGQSTGVSASTSVLSMNTQDWSPLGWITWISLQSKGLLRLFSNTTVQKHQFFGTQLSL